MQKFPLLLVFVVIFLWYVPGKVAAMPNPSAVYCEETGNEFEVRETSEGQEGFCRFSSGGECNAWNFFRKCSLGEGGDMCGKDCNHEQCRKGDDCLCENGCDRSEAFDPLSAIRSFFIKIRQICYRYLLMLYND